MDKILKARRKELNMTLEEVGDYVGVSKATVQRWESGNISNMRRDKIKKLSEILQISSDTLLSFSEENENNETVKEDIKKQTDIYEKKDDRDCFEVKIEDDSMAPRIVCGDRVVVKRQSEVESGQIAVVENEGRIFCKKVMKHSDGIVLVSSNIKYAPMFFSLNDIESKKIKILGRAVELRAKL